MKRYSRIHLKCLCVLGLSGTSLPSTGTASACVGIPPIVIAHCAPGCARVCPDGNGEPLGSKGMRVTITILDADGHPIAGFPRQDIGLADRAGGHEISLCSQGWRAIAETNQHGMTTIAGSGFAGGHTQLGMFATVSGVRAVDYPLPIQIVSSDLNADLVVDMLDLSAVPDGFAARYMNGEYDFPSDLVCDGVENLLDVTTFAIDFGADCP